MKSTQDSFFQGKVKISQPRLGYRFSIDAPILANFLPTTGLAALEIGSGCGVVSLLSLYLKKFPLIHAIEIQKELAELMRENIIANGFEKKLLVYNDNFNFIYKNFGGIRNIFANPPYQKLNTGKESKLKSIQMAKSELTLSLEDLLGKSAEILSPDGRLYLILPYARIRQLRSLATANQLFFERLRLVYSFADGKPERILVQLSNYEAKTVEMEPLIVFAKKGKYTQDMDVILTGEQ